MGDATVIGVHVCGGTLRRAELTRRGERIEVVRLSSMAAPAPREAAPAGRPSDIPSANGSRWVAALPASEVMTRCWPLPNTADARLRQLVAHRLEADLPVPMAELTWGYRRGAGPKGGDGNCTVLAQAARSERIGRYLSTLATAGVRVDLLTTEAEALSGLYRHGLNAPDADDLLVLAGEREWLVCLFGGGVVQAVRRLQVDPADAGPACRECRQLIAAQLAPGALKRIRWCAGAEQAEAARLLSESCGVPVEPVEVRSLLTGSDGPLTAAQWVEYGPAIGLALAGLMDREHLIRLAGADAEEEAAPLRRLDRLLARPAAWIAGAAALLLVALVIHVAALRWETRRMQSSLAVLATPNAAVELLERKIRAMQRLERYRIDVEAICSDICAAVKDPITLTSLQLSRERRLTIKGNSKDPKLIYTFADDLRKSPRFAAVNPERAAPGQGGDFTITLELAGVEKFSSPGLRGAR